MRTSAKKLVKNEDAGSPSVSHWVATSRTWSFAGMRPLAIPSRRELM